MALGLSQDAEELSNHCVRLLIAARRIKVLDNPKSMCPKEPVPFMLLGRTLGRMERLSIDLKDAPPALVADEKVGLTVDTNVGARPKTRSAVRRDGADRP